MTHPPGAITDLLLFRGALFFLFSIRIVVGSIPRTFHFLFHKGTYC